MASKRHLHVAVLYLLMALTLGGAGVRYPLLEMLVELGGLLLLLLVGLSPNRPRLRWDGRIAIGLLLLVVLTPLIQLIPLPPRWWSHLPGRALPEEISQLAGLAEVWRPLSLSPEATRRSLLSLVPGAAMLVAVLYAPPGHRIVLLRVVVGFAIVATALGAVQLASGDGVGVTPYDSPYLGYPVGFFVNRNHQATLLLVAIVLAAAVAVSRRGRPEGGIGRWFYATIVIAVFALGVIATTSRMGMTLLPLAIASASLILLQDRVTWKTVTLIGVGLAGLGLVATETSLFERTLDRFATAQEDDRYLYWQDTLWTLPQFMPAGTGIGSFVPVYQTAESLDYVGPAFVNHAHNEYLELALEGGVPALLVTLLVAAFLLFAGRRLLRLSPRRTERLIGLSALAGILLILLHSIVDYPLRMSALSALFGMLVGLTCRAPAAEPAAAMRTAPSDGDQPVARPPRPVFRGTWSAAWPLLAIPLAGLIGWQSVAAGLSAHAILDQRFADAAVIAPWSSTAFDREATRLMFAHQPRAAATQARAALAISPIDVAAVRTLGLSYEMLGNPTVAAALLSAAGKLGWRDRPTQLWLVQDALQREDATVLVQRADALLRQNVLSQPILSLLHAQAVIPRIGAALAERLAESPGWRAAFLAGGATLKPADFGGQKAVLDRLTQSKAPPTVEETRGFLRQLVAAGDYRNAHDVWRRFSGGTAVFDGGFARSGDIIAKADGGPFEWQVPKLLGTSIAVDEPDSSVHGAAARIQTDGLAVGPVLRQTLLLAPGRYAFSAMVRDIEPGSVSTFTWELTCLDEPGHVQPIALELHSQRDNWVDARGSVVIPSEHCSVQQLSLRSTATSAHAEWLDDVRLDRWGASVE